MQLKIKRLTQTAKLPVKNNQTDSGEIWVDVNGFEGLYEISNIGRVKSIKRNGTLGGLMKIRKNRHGYPMVYLTKNNKAKNCTVHRLVALSFLKKVTGKNFVNHVDGNKENNCVENLEWVSRSENQTHAYELGLQKVNIDAAHQAAWEKKRRKINQFESDGTFIRGFNSITEAAKDLNISASGISQCLSGKNKKSGGYIWKYMEVDELSQSDLSENKETNS